MQTVRVRECYENYTRGWWLGGLRKRISDISSTHTERGEDNRTRQESTPNRSLGNIAGS